MKILPDDVRRNPYPMFEQMRPQSPVYMPGADIWMILDYDSVKQTLSDPDTFSSSVSRSRNGNFEWLMFMDPPRHTKLRAIVSRAFTPRSIANLEARIRQLSRELLDPLVARGEMDLVTDFASTLPVMVMAELIGFPLSEWPRLTRWSLAIMGLAETISGTEEESHAAGATFGQANEEMKQYLDGLLRDRRARPKDDLLTRLVEAEVDGERLTETETLRFVQLLLAAGSETTTNLISNAVLCFIECPEQLVRLRTAPELLPSAIEEVLRYRSPGQTMLRTPNRDVELKGRVIPAGKLVLVMIGSANRDPKHFPEAQRFDIARDPNPHLAFGQGIHFCLGAPLARLEARVALQDLLWRDKNMELATDAPWEPRRAFNVLGPIHLQIRWK